MKLQQLNIINFRALKEAEIHFSPGFNVLVGENGAGKSTVIRALEIMLSSFTSHLNSRNGKGRQISAKDIFHTMPYACLTLTTDQAAWQKVLVDKNYRGSVPVKTMAGAVNAYADQLVTAYTGGTVDGKEHYNIPMVASYSVNRSLIDIPARVHEKHEMDALSLYRRDIDAGSNLRIFYEWFRERENYENAVKVNSANLNFSDKQLDVVRSVVNRLLPEYDNLRVRRNPHASGFELRKGKQYFSIDQLSDGEKCYLTLVCDIARRLAICNPLLEQPLHGEGIVLIDEIELHLHPAWQAMAIDKLRNLFPNIQFVITTHSPHVVQNLRESLGDSLIVLSDSKVYETEAKYGDTLDHLLLGIFNLDSLRPLTIRKSIDRVWHFLNQGDFDSDGLQAALSALGELIPKTDGEMATINLQMALNRRRHDKD